MLWRLVFWRSLQGLLAAILSLVFLRLLDGSKDGPAHSQIHSHTNLNRPLKTSAIIASVLVGVLIVAAVTVAASPLRQAFNNSSGSVPQTITYQGVLTDARGEFVPDGPYEATFNIYMQESGGFFIWSEVHEVQVEGGLFTVALGGKNDIADALERGPELYLGVKIGDSPELTPRQPITSAPFAIKAADSQTLNGLSAQEIADAAASAGSVAECAQERQLATRVNRYIAPEDCINPPNTVEHVAATLTPSIAVRSDGRPVIAYANADGHLHIAICADPACAASSVVALGTQTPVMGGISVDVDSQDRPTVSYANGITGNLEIAVCDTAACGEAQIIVLDDLPLRSEVFIAAGRLQDMVISPTDAPIIAYTRERNEDLERGGTAMRATCSDRICSEVTLTRIENVSSFDPDPDPSVYEGPGAVTSIDTDINGFPLIFRAGTFLDKLTFRRCFDSICENDVLRFHLSELGDPTSGAVRFAQDLEPLLVLTIGDTLVYLRCTDLECGVNDRRAPNHTGSGGILQTVDPFDERGDGPGQLNGVSMVRTPRNQVVIAYIDETHGLMVTHCDTVECNSAPTQTRIAFDTTGGTDMALGTDGVPIITYLSRDPGTGDYHPRTWRCEDCTEW